VLKHGAQCLSALLPGDISYVIVCEAGVIRASGGDHIIRKSHDPADKNVRILIFAGVEVAHK
jgi:hypothetical protein